MRKHATPSLANQILSVLAHRSLSVPILKVISCCGTRMVCMAYETMQQLGGFRGDAWTLELCDTWTLELCDTWTLECVVPYFMYSGLSL